jgi:hypothetical protein
MQACRLELLGGHNMVIETCRSQYASRLRFAMIWIMLYDVWMADGSWKQSCVEEEAICSSEVETSKVGSGLPLNDF